jgi:predicted pyridoxine 5'-phosphate oxidase superfamily flavin-nucleotide-binding protein
MSLHPDLLFREYHEMRVLTVSRHKAYLLVVVINLEIRREILYGHVYVRIVVDTILRAAILSKRQVSTVTCRLELNLHGNIDELLT